MIKAIAKKVPQKTNNKKTKEKENELNKRAMGFLKETFSNPNLLNKKDLYNYVYKNVIKGRK